MQSQIRHHHQAPEPLAISGDQQCQDSGGQESRGVLREFGHGSLHHARQSEAPLPAPAASNVWLRRGVSTNFAFIDPRPAALLGRGLRQFGCW